MTDSNYYLNYFPWRKPPQRLFISEVRPKHENLVLDEKSDHIFYKHAANLAGKLSNKENIVASKGRFLISNTEIDDISDIIDLFLGGLLLKEVKTEIINKSEVELNGSNIEFFKNFLNRKLDHYMDEAGFIQNRRFYWKPENVRKLDKNFNVNQGVIARTQVFSNQKAYLLSDFQTHYFSKLTIWDVIREILVNKGLTDWKNADPKDFNFLRNKTVESKYRIWKGYWIFESGKIDHLDINQSIKDTVVGDKKISILDYHKKAGRKIEEEEQPVLYVRRGRNILSYVPSLLRETPNMENLKRYNPRLSKIASEISRKDPFSRYFEIADNLDHLIENGIISLPQPVPVDTFFPQITMNDDFIEIKQDKDFIKYFSKGKIAKKPLWSKTHIFFDEKYEPILKEFLKELKTMIRKFKLKMTWQLHPFSSNLKIDGKAYLKEYKDFILNESKGLNKDELVIWAVYKHINALYSDLKYELTIQKDISTQQILINSLKKSLDNDALRTGYVNPLFPQLLAKMGGYPYLFQAGITMSNTIFIGLDRFRDPNKEKPSITAAAASFSEYGEYLGAASNRFDASPTDDFFDLDSILTTLLDDLVSRKIEFSKVIVLRDGRIHDLQDEIDVVFDTFSKYSVKGAFLTANKSSQTRIFKGPSLDEIEEIPEQYISIYNFDEDNSFIIASTQPIISNGTPKGTARPMLYRIEKHNLLTNLDRIKIDLSRAIAAFTRLNWASFKGNRLPAPLIFAHNLADMCSKAESKWSIKLKRPTFL